MSPHPPRIHVRPRMGTLLGLTVRARGLADGDRAAARAFALAARLERQMTPFDPRSALSRVNRAGGRAVTVPAPLATLLRIARQLAEVTDGAFDPTLAPLVDLWREAARRSAPPSRDALRRARRRVGWRAIAVRGRRVALARAGVALDLGGIGKGWAADRIATLLARTNGLSVLINFGESTVVAVGAPPRADGWPVLLRHPQGGFAGWFPLAEGACSTSGSLGRTWRVGAHTVGHVIDPRSGRPLAAPAQATVLARSATVAEAASTALLVEGRAALAPLARRLGAEACWIDGGGIVATEGFPLRRFPRRRAA